MLRTGTCKDISWSKAYHRWCDYTRAKFLRNTNPFHSCVNLMNSCKNMSLCFTRELPALFRVLRRSENRFSRDMNVQKFSRTKIIRRTAQNLSSLQLWHLQWARGFLLHTCFHNLEPKYTGVMMRVVMSWLSFYGA